MPSGVNNGTRINIHFNFERLFLMTRTHVIREKSQIASPLLGDTTNYIQNPYRLESASGPF